MTFEQYWNSENGASIMKERAGSSLFFPAPESQLRKAAKEIWNEAMKYGRTDNDIASMTFLEYWNESGIGDQIDQKNRWRFITQIDKSGLKSAMEEVWNDAVEHGEKGSIKINDNNSSFNLNT